MLSPTGGPSMGEVRTYVLVFQIDPVHVNIAALERYLTDSREILGYWAHIPFVYFFKSRLLANDLANRFVPFFPQLNFVIAEISPLNLNGMMPPQTWQWFYADHSEKREPGWGALTFGDLLAPPRKE